MSVVGWSQSPSVGLGVSGHADVEVDDLLGDEADVEGHLTVLHGQGPLPSLASLAWNMELSVSKSAV